MTDNVLTLARQAIIARLGTITTANGYLTNVGSNVRSGWFNEVIKEQPVGSGMVVLQKGKGMPPSAGPAALKMHPGFHVIGAVDAGLDGYEDAIEAIELDLIRCLMPAHAKRLEWLPAAAPTLSVGAPEPFPPGDGLSAATILVPIYLTSFIEL